MQGVEAIFFKSSTNVQSGDASANLRFERFLSKLCIYKDLNKIFPLIIDFCHVHCALHTCDSMVWWLKTLAYETFVTE